MGIDHAVDCRAGDQGRDIKQPDPAEHRQQRKEISPAMSFHQFPKRSEVIFRLVHIDPPSKCVAA